MPAPGACIDDSVLVGRFLRLLQEEKNSSCVYVQERSPIRGSVNYGHRRLVLYDVARATTLLFYVYDFNNC